jgi:hypothetical protein
LILGFRSSRGRASCRAHLPSRCRSGLVEQGTGIRSERPRRRRWICRRSHAGRSWERLSGPPDWVVLLAAIAAEVDRIELSAFGLPARREALGVEGDVSLTDRLKCGQYLAGAADELVELERKRRTALRCAHVVRSHQESAKPSRASSNSHSASAANRFAASFRVLASPGEVAGPCR